MRYGIVWVSEPTVLPVIVTPCHTFIWCLLHTPYHKTPYNVISCLDVINIKMRQDMVTVILTKGDSASTLCPIKETWSQDAAWVNFVSYESCTRGRVKGQSPSRAWSGGWQQWPNHSGGQTANGEPRAEVSQATNWKPGADVDWISNRTTKAGAGGTDDGERKDPGAGDASTNPGSGDLSTEPQPGGASANPGPQGASADPGTDELFLKN